MKIILSSKVKTDVGILYKQNDVNGINSKSSHYEGGYLVLCWRNQ